VTFKRDALLYDIKNIAYVEADIMETDDAHQRHQVFDIGEDGNVDRVTRVLDLAFAACVELCYPFAKTPARPYMEITDTFRETDVYILSLRVPEDFSATSHILLENMIHEILVDAVLADWLSITKPGAEKKWMEKLEQLVSDLPGVLNNHGRRVRRTLTPW
jgi:hypothetical protein